MNLSDLLVTYNLVKTSRTPKLYEFTQESVRILPEKENKINDENLEEKGSYNSYSSSKYTISPSLTGVTARAKRINNGLDYNNFITSYNNFLELNPLYEKYKDLLTAIAGLESDYKQDASNRHSSALGWFLFLDLTRSDYTNASREDFVSNPNIQFEVASKHLDLLMDQVRPYKRRALDLGLTDLLLMYGMWWRPSSMINYLRTGSDDYVNAGDDMTLLKILNYAS